MDNKLGGWRERLQDLYLTVTPDEEGLHTKTISFNWGKFEFAAKDKNNVVEFYICTRNAIESFIERELASEKAQVVKEASDIVAGMKHFGPLAEYGYFCNEEADAYNNALRDVLEALQQLTEAPTEQ